MQEGALLMFDLGDAGLTGPADELVVRLFTEEGMELLNRSYPLVPDSNIEPFLRAACGRAAAEFFRDRLFVGMVAAPLSHHLDEAAFRTFRTLRRRVLRQTLDGLDGVLG